MRSAIILLALLVLCSGCGAAANTAGSLREFSAGPYVDTNGAKGSSVGPRMDDNGRSTSSGTSLDPSGAPDGNRTTSAGVIIDPNG